MNKNEFKALFSKLDRMRVDIEGIIGRGVKLSITSSLDSQITLEIENHIFSYQLEAIIDYFKPLGYYLNDIEAEHYRIVLDFSDFYEFMSDENERDGEGNKKN